MNVVVTARDRPIRTWVEVLEKDLKMFNSRRRYPLLELNGKKVSILKLFQENISSHLYNNKIFIDKC